MKALLTFILFFSTLLVSGQNKSGSYGFIENKGQIIDQKGKPNPNVKYLLNTNGLNVQLRENGFSYDVYEVEKKRDDLKKIRITNETNNYVSRYGTKPRVSCCFYFCRNHSNSIHFFSKYTIATCFLSFMRAAFTKEFSFPRYFNSISIDDVS